MKPFLFLLSPLLLVPLVTLGSCESKQSEHHRAAPMTSTAASSTPPIRKSGIEACDRLLAAIDGCLQKTTGSAAESWRELRDLYVKQAQRARSDAAKKAVAIGCSAELDALDDCE